MRSAAAARHVYRETELTITVTIGCGSFDGARSFADCLRRVDDALYAGKRQGHDQVVAVEPAAPRP